MILTRIERGAVRTSVLIRNKLINRFQNSPAPRLSMARIALLSTVAVRMVIVPVPIATAADAALANDTEPPSTQRIAASAASAVTLSSTPTAVLPLAVSSFSLQSIEVGKSLSTLEEEKKEAERVRLEQENAAKAKAKEAAKMAQLRKLASATTTAAPAQVTVSGNIQDIARNLTASAFNEAQWPAMHALIMRESGYNLNSYNARSGACGLPQALPCSKLKDRSAEGQINWMLNYIRARYGSPIQALAHHNLFGWY